MVCGGCQLDGKRKEEYFDADTCSHLLSDEKMRLVHSSVQIEFSNMQIALNKSVQI